MCPAAIQTQREKITLAIAPDGILWIDAAGTILLANAAMEQLSGYTKDEMVGANLSLLLPEHLRERHNHNLGEYFQAPRVRAMGHVELALLCQDGSQVPVDISLGYWEEDSNRFAVAYIRDLTDRKAYEETLRYQATHDALTKLPNRWLYSLQLQQALALAKRSGRLVCVMLLDVDGFKLVNDGLGHFWGDALLVQIGNRLREVLRENDTLARIGGDEFAVLLREMDSEAEALVVAKKLLWSFEQPFTLNQQSVQVSASCGLALYPHDASGSEDLLRFADMAMYQAKRAGRATYAYYSAEMDRVAQQERAIQSRLKKALQRGQLTLHYQPQVQMGTRRIVGAEALLRWRDDELGDVSPARFIPVAENSGLIHALSDWVLETTCRQIATWESMGMPLRVAVNFSAQQFKRTDLLREVEDVLRRTGASSHLLEIEITETAAMASPEEARTQIRGLKALGCDVTLDDFGTGYSSLGYLKKLPVSQLKIDREFVNGIPHDEDDARITKSVIALAHSFGMSVVAEGIETVEQEAFLRRLGCETWQGWLFSKAVAPEALQAMLQSQAASITPKPHVSHPMQGATP